jgi:hypothetical protein
MAEFSEISESILAMRAVWSAIKFESCFSAQKRIVKEISDLRKKIPASSFPTDIATFKSHALPIDVTSIMMVESEAQSKLERVKIKNKDENTGAMATFFNPYANKKDQDESTIVPEEEERYIMVKFANHLSIPLEIPRCQLEFNINASQTDRIKAPAISFVIPGQTKNFAVQFPFIVLKQEATTIEIDATAESIFEIKGLHLTCLARSFFIPLKNSSDDSAVVKSNDYPLNIPDAASLYPRRKYTNAKVEIGNRIRSPKIEVIPAQPNLQVLFASSPTPLGEDTVIPVPIADGEVFLLPKLFLSNDSGINGIGKIEKLRITATGLPGLGEIVLFDISGPMTEGDDVENKRPKKEAGAVPLSLSVDHQGLDIQTLNDPKQCKASSLSLVLTATPDMGAVIRGCSVKVTFRYRGKTASPTLEVWRKREIEIGIMRIKGPRISSLTFRPDLSWKSGYSELCSTLSRQENHARYRPSRIRHDFDLLRTGSTDDENFVASRLGSDPGVHVCGDQVVALLSVVNDSTVPITLSSPNGPVGGFEGHELTSVKVMPGVSAKIPMILPRIDRAPGIAQELLTMTRLTWKSELVDNGTEASTETGGTILPVNRRVRTGSMEIPLPNLKTIIDENSTFLSRICKAPCSITVGLVGEVENSPANVATEKPVNVVVEIHLADWVADDVLKDLKQTLQFCCARKGANETNDPDGHRRDYVWCGHVRKSLRSKDITRKSSHKARLLFLQEGEYFVSACLSFSKLDAEDDVKETWWAEKAQTVRVKRAPTSQ